MSKIDFSQVLKHLQSDEALRAKLLYHLSMPNRQNLADFQAAWPTIPLLRRQECIRRLAEITEDSFEVYFDPLFITALNDDDPQVQAAAIDGLEENVDPALIPVLGHLLHEGKTIDVRSSAATALGKYVYLGEVDEISPEAQTLAEQALLKSLRDPAEDTFVMRRSLEAIAFSSRPGIEKLIADAYEHEDTDVQASAIFAMGRHGAERWQQIVLDNLRQDNPALRYEAAQASGELILVDALPLLVSLIDQDSDIQIKQAAIWSLGQIGGNVAQETLEILIESEDALLVTAAEDALEAMTMFDGIQLGILDSLEQTLAADLDDDLENDDEDEGAYRTFYLN